MIPDKLIKSIQTLSSDLVMMDGHSSGEEWRNFAGRAEALAGELLAVGEADGQELADAMAKVAGRLATGTVANSEAGFLAVRDIVHALQDLEKLSGISESARKQALAEANLFLRDLKREESKTKEATNVDADERREMIIAIEQRVDELEQDLLSLATPESDSENVRSIFRQFHTLKGEGAICGIKSVADFCHRIETEIEDARHGKLVLTSGVVEALQELTGLLRPILAGKTVDQIGATLVDAMIDSLRTAVAESKSAPPSSAASEGQSEDKFKDFFAGLDLGPPREEGDTEEGDKHDRVAEVPPVRPSPYDMVERIDPGLPIQDDIDGGDQHVLFRGPKQADTVIDSGDIAESIEKRIQTGPVQEKPIDTTEIKAVSIDVHRVDALMELIGEVGLLGTHLSHQLTVANLVDFTAQANSLVRACRRLQEITNALRMTSIRPLFMTVRRSAVDAARASRKLIDFNMRGIDSQVDRSIVENLSAALIHVVRNAVDHGIETADVRRRAGKNERGRISISAQRTDSDVIIELSDDGKGFDLDAIHDKAVAMGKIGPDDKLTDSEVADLVFLPGLSTAKKVTGLSGRGVGMEIVRTSIDSLRGRVEVSTKRGVGTTVKMRFPTAVSAMEGLLVGVGESILIFPVTAVRECFRVSSDHVSTIEGRGTIVTIRGVVVPVLFLGREFGISGKAECPEDGVLVLLELGDLLTAVLVDDTYGTQQVIIRTLEGPLADLPLVSGAAILADRRLGLVVETSHLVERVSIASGRAFSEAGRRQADTGRQVDTVSIGSNQVGMIDFAIMGLSSGGQVREHVFAINAFKTREFVPVRDLRPLPNAPAGFAGMMLLRNATVPVVNMGLVLGLMSEADRRPEWEQIVLLCEFAGKTVGFLVTRVNRVSYISWSDIMPPPSTGGLIQLDYIVGSILMSRLKGTLREGSGAGADGPDKLRETSFDSCLDAAEGGLDESQVAFVLDFERIVGNVIQLYGDMGSELGDMAAGRKGGCRILLAEDSPLIRKQTVKALTKAGIDVIEAGDGQEAWDKVLELQAKAEANGENIFTYVDLVLSDIEMPRLDGYTFTYNMKHHPQLRVLPVLLHSSITNDNMIKRANEVEADGFIPKCDPKELAAQLKKYL